MEQRGSKPLPENKFSMCKSISKTERMQTISSGKANRNDKKYFPEKYLEMQIIL